MATFLRCPGCVLRRVQDGEFMPGDTIEVVHETECQTEGHDHTQDPKPE